MNDRKLTQLFLSRSDKAVYTLAQAYGKQLQQIALNILGSVRDAQECVNDTYLAIWNAIPPNEPDPLCAYVYRTCRNIAAKRLRANTAQKRNTGCDVSLDELAECIGSDDLLSTLSAQELGRAIDAFLKTLSKDNRMIFLRRYWFGDTVKSIAKRMQLSENTVSVRLNRIRGKLKEYLIKEGFLDET